MWKYNDDGMILKQNTKYKWKFVHTRWLYYAHLMGDEK